jgi:putative transposase
VVVHRANIPDRDGATFVLDDGDTRFPRLQKIWVDQAYTGTLAKDVYEQYQSMIEIVEKPPDQKGFTVVPRRWVVERTFAWLGRNRRLSKEYEHRPEYSESWIYISSIARMIRRLHPNETEERPYIRKHQSTREGISAR